MICRTLVIGMVGLLGCAPLSGQADTVPSATQAEILRAVAEHVLESMEQGADSRLDLVMDRAIMQSDGAEWPADVLESIPGFRPGTLEDHHTCAEEGAPGVCYLEGADVVVTVGRPDIEGDTGTVLMRQVRRSSGDVEPSRAYQSSALLKISRSPQGWSVVGAEYISVS